MVSRVDKIQQIYENKKSNYQSRSENIVVLNQNTNLGKVNFCLQQRSVTANLVKEWKTLL